MVWTTCLRHKFRRSKYRAIFTLHVSQRKARNLESVDLHEAMFIKLTRPKGPELSTMARTIIFGYQSLDLLAEFEPVVIGLFKVRPASATTVGPGQEHLRIILSMPG
jgi:hypothetical protein